MGHATSLQGAHRASRIRLPSTTLALSQVGLTASLTHVAPADLTPPEHKPLLGDNRPTFTWPREHP